MSGAEADISSDGDTSFDDDDVPLPASPLKLGTADPFEVVLKGGKPWGFNLATETKSPVRISEISAEGVAAESGQLQVGDIVLQVNDVRCATGEEAGQLIDSAFRTLALQIWRGTTETTTSPVRSASFLQKTRELSERARQAAVQDDSALFTQSKSASASKMKPRQRRIESFHGGNRRHSAQSGASSLAAGSHLSPGPHLSPGSRLPPTPRDNTPSTTDTDSTTTSDAAAAAAAAARTSLKGWATEHDLSSSRQPVIMSGKHGTVASSRHMPLTPAKSTSNLNQEKQKPPDSSRSPLSLSNAKSTPDIPDHLTHDNVTSPTSPKSPSWYPQKFGNRSSMFDFSSAPPPRRTAGSPRHSYASGSPRNSYASGSPRNSFSGYSSGYTGSSVTGFSPMSVSTAMMDQSSQRTPSHYVQNTKLTGANVNSYDDMPSKPLNKNYDRRSLPPQMSQFRHDSHKENIPSAGIKTDAHKLLTSMPVTREEEELDRELSDLKHKVPNDLDLQTVHSPPAPPVRDISSLKYVTMKQNHEKFPSWPVVTSHSPQNLGAGVQGAPVSERSGERGSDSDKKSSDSDRSDKMEVQKYSRSGENKSSPHGDRKSFEETKQNRNQSDPGFKQKPKKTFYTTRKAVPPKTVPDYENIKSEEERFEDFCTHSKPGYPPPKFDPDGHNFGDEKYSIPSPPERDMPNLDEKTLVQKIAEVISPPSVYQSRSSYPMLDSARSHVGTDMQSPGLAKIQGPYFHQALNSTNHSRLPFSQPKSTVDSGTSPLSSPSEEKNKLNFRTLTANPKKETLLSPTDKPRGLIIRQMPYYNTSTQTDDNIGNQSSKSDKESFENQSVLGGMSQSAAPLVYHPSDTSSQSSGIGSMSFADQHSAPMLRKLSEEFYRGKLTGSISGSEKRMSSASTYEELKSPRSETSHYGGMREAESYNSVVIHSQEHAGPFGSDDFGSSPSLTSSRHDLEENYSDPYKARRSIDSAMLLNKVSAGNLSMPPRSLQDSRFTSDSNLSSGNYAWGNHGYSQSLLHLNRPVSATGEYNPHATAMFTHSSTSSSTSRPSGSMEARSSGSGSRLGSDSSAAGTAKNRTDSDSVFYDRTSPAPGTDAANQKAAGDDRNQNVNIGRKESMKLAYGTYDEHHYATPYGHQRNNSEVLSSGPEVMTGHSRSQSLNDYLPMHYNQGPSDIGSLGQIKEEGPEVRWQEALKKSRSLSRDVGNSDYANVSVSQGEVIWRTSDSDKSDTEVKKVKDSKTRMRRTASEQIRPPKVSKHQHGNYDVSASASTKDYSSSGESSKGNKSESDTSVKVGMSQHFSESDLKRVQQKAVLDFVERKKKGSDSSDPHSPKDLDSSPESFTSEKTLLQPPSSPLEDITKRYNYTKAQRAESLRRTQSISSNSSKDSNVDYMDMRRLEQRNYQTEWSRLRSMDSVAPKRPLSVGSDISGMDLYAMSGHSRETSISHSRSASETGVKQVISASEDDSVPGPPPSCSNDKMVTSPVYPNFEQDYPRRPPPPVPGSTEDQPPALPPRTQRFSNSKSESFLFSGLSAKQQDELKDNYLLQSGDRGENGTLRRDAYAEQLRRQARRLSEQPKAMPMQIVSTKSTLLFSMSQSYKQEPAPALEALPLQSTTATTTVSTATSVIPSEMVSVLNHSPPNRGRHTPEPPPLPTPLKNGETELDPDLNKTADFPPPSDFLESEEVKEDSGDRCADDSYGSYRSRREPREVGKYTRTVSDSHVFKASRDHKQLNQEHAGKDVTETPNKPPRKKLELKGRDSPVHGQQSNSTSSLKEAEHSSSQQMAPPHVPAFHAAETISVHHPQKAMAKPLQSLSVQNYGGQTGGNVVSTHVQKPSQSAEDDSPSVRDRVKKLEVYSHSPSSGKVVVQRLNESSVSAADHKREPSPHWRGNNSLENLENSVMGSHSNNLNDRLSPVVKRNEIINSNMNKYGQPPSPSDHLHGEMVDKVDLSPPPQVPSRTYKQAESYSADRPPRPGSRPSEPRDSPYRSNSFQKRNLMHPQPYQSKAVSSVHPATPPHPSGASQQEPKRSPSQSVPEPQVPSRMVTQRKGSDSSQDHSHQGLAVQYKTDMYTSPEHKIVYSEKVAAQHKDSSQQQSVHTGQNQHKDSSQQQSVHTGQNQHKDSSQQQSVHTGQNQHKDSSQQQSVHTGQKRSYEYSSFSKSRSSSASQPSNSHSISSATSPESFNFNNNHPAARPTENSYSRPQAHREPVSEKGDDSYDLDKSRVRSPVNQTVTYHSGDFKNWRKNQSENQSIPRNNNNQSESLDQSGSFIETENNLKNKQINSVDNVDKEANNKLVNMSIHHGRQPSAEELECDVKAHELARVLPESDKVLSQVLQTDSSKNRMQYMGDLFPVGEEGETQKRTRQVTERDEKESKTEEEEKNEPTSPMPSNYYVSPPKAMIELELRKFGDTSQLCQGIGDNDTLAQKKEELLQSMEKKMALLRTDRKELQSDIEENENLGKQVMVSVETNCRIQQEKDKYKTYIEDIDKIIKLLLKLSGLLARAENTIQGLTDNTNEKIKKMTYDKRDRLHQQHEDAKELKLDIDRRREQVEVILRENLSASEMDDYQYYIKMKSKYTIQLQELEDKITLGSEQIQALKKSIPNIGKSVKTDASSLS